MENLYDNNNNNLGINTSPQVNISGVIDSVNGVIDSINSGFISIKLKSEIKYLLNCKIKFSFENNFNGLFFDGKYISEFDKNSDKINYKIVSNITDSSLSNFVINQDVKIYFIRTFSVLEIDSSQINGILPSFQDICETFNPNKIDDENNFQYKTGLSLLNDDLRLRLLESPKKVLFDLKNMNISNSAWSKDNKYIQFKNIAISSKNNNPELSIRIINDSNDYCDYILNFINDKYTLHIKGIKFNLDFELFKYVETIFGNDLYSIKFSIPENIEESINQYRIVLSLNTSNVGIQFTNTEFINQTINPIYFSGIYSTIKINKIETNMFIDNYLDVMFINSDTIQTNNTFNGKYISSGKNFGGLIFGKYFINNNDLKTKFGLIDLFDNNIISGNFIFTSSLVELILNNNTRYKFDGISWKLIDVESNGYFEHILIDETIIPKIKY